MDDWSNAISFITFLLSLFLRKMKQYFAYFNICNEECKECNLL